MNHLDALRAPILSSDMPWLSYVVERIFFDPAYGDSRVKVFAGRPAALDRFVQHCGGELTEAAAVRVIAEGTFYRPTIRSSWRRFGNTDCYTDPQARPKVLLYNRSTRHPAISTFQKEKAAMTKELSRRAQ